MRKILPIVEGVGDEKAVPTLVRKILHAHEIFDVELQTAHKRNDFSKLHNTFDNYFTYAIKFNAPILWVLDFDCKNCVCVKDAAESLYTRANAIRPNWPFKVAFIEKEFESLFLAEKQATKALFSIDDKFTFPTNVKSIRDAKGVITSALPRGWAYKETVHQEKIAAQLNLDILRDVSADYRHLEKSVLYLAGIQEC